MRFRAGQDHAVGSCARSSRGTASPCAAALARAGESHAARPINASMAAERQEGAQADAPSFAAPRGEHRILGGSGEHLQRKARTGDSRHEHALVQDRARRPPVMRPSRSTTAEISGSEISSSASRGSEPRDDGAIARAKVDKASFADVDRAVERSKFSISITAAMTPLNAPPGALRRRDVTKRHFVPSPPPW